MSRPAGAHRAGATGSRLDALIYCASAGFIKAGHPEPTARSPNSARVAQRTTRMKLTDYCTKHAVYQNIPMQPLHGRAAIKDFLEGVFAALDGVDFRFHCQLGNGHPARNERLP